MTTQSHTMPPRAARLFLTCAFALAGCAGKVDSEQHAAVGVAEAALAKSCLPDIPPAIAVPDGNRLAFHLKGVGDQIYACTATTTATGTTFGWVFQAPDADLFFPNGHLAGSHYAGPTWEALDGSTVVGKKLAGVTVDASAVPWLLLEAASHSGKGMMSKVSYIQRLSTTGGIAPSKACSADNAGEVSNEHYTADYFFYVPSPSKAGPPGHA